MKMKTTLIVCHILLLSIGLCAQNLTVAEYFFDTDPGVGNGIALPSFTPSDTVSANLNIPVVGLSEGVHFLYVRYRDDNNRWGIYERNPFYVLPSTPLQPPAADLLVAEYFFDTDPGVGNGIALPNFTPSDTVNLLEGVSVSGLTVGLHRLYTRFKDASGKWGIYEGREFEVVDCQFPLVAVSVSGAACDGAEVMLSDLSTQVEPGATYAWDVDNDGVVDYTTAGDVTHTFPGSGTYTVELMVENTEVCKDSTTIEVTVNPVYNLSETVSICSGESYTFPDGTEQSNITTQVVYTSNLQTVGAGCDSIIETTVNVNPAYDLSETVSVCSGESYTFPDGTEQSNITTQVVYTSSLQTVGAGCDSIIETTVNVNPTYYLSETVSVCFGESYTFPDGSAQNNITTQVVYTSSLQTVGTGCDSIVETTVNVNPTYDLSETVSVCSGESYTFPDGSTQNNITTQVVYTSSLQTVGTGCDSIVETTVNVNPTYDLSETVSVCSGESYTFPDGTEQSNITSQVVYVSNLTTVNACDSVITTTVNAISYDEIVNVTICSGSDYTFPDGTEQINITQDVVQVSTLTSLLSCDSTVTTNITVGADFQTAETASVCAGGSYTFPDGTIQMDITQQVVYTSTLQATSSSCDSLVTTTVEVITVDTAVTVNGADLVANATNADYQWLDCDNGFSAITGADAAVFMPTGNGNYAVEVTQQGCADTSSCYNVFTVGVESLTDAETVTVYPNPTNGQLYVSYSGNDQPSYMIVDASGRMLLNGVLPTTGNLNLSALATGVYQLTFTTQNEQLREQIIITK